MDSHMTVRTQPENAPVGGEDTPSPPHPLQARVDAILADPKGPYWDPDHPQHREIVAQVQRLLAEKEGVPVPGTPTPEEPRDVADLRRQVGVTLPPVPQQAQWDTEAEADVLQWAIRENVAPATVQALYTWYADWAVLGDSRPPAEVEDSFRQYAKKHGLSARQIETLVAWHREVILLANA